MNLTKHILIVGGSSGLGLELAFAYAARGHRVTVTGRKNPKQNGIMYIPFSITSDVNDVDEAVEKLASTLDPIDAVVYAAGYFQEGTLRELSDESIMTMMNVGLLAPVLLVKALIAKALEPLDVMFITSSSQVTPREKEPVYTAVKAGLGMFGNSLALDAGVGKVVVIAPAGMKTPFWDETKDVSSFLEPSWVAEQIVELSGGSFKYKFAKILRDPARVETVEMR